MNDLSTQVFHETLNALIENLYRNQVSVWLVEDCLDLIAKSVTTPDWEGGRTATLSLSDIQIMAAQETAVMALHSPRAENLFSIIIDELEPRLATLEFENAVTVLANPSRSSLQQLREAQQTVVDAWDEDGLAEATDEQLEVILNYQGGRLTAYSHMLMELMPVPSGWETGLDVSQLVAV